MSTRLLTVPEVASQLRVNNSTVRRLAATGKLRGFKPATHWRFTQDDVDAYLSTTTPVVQESSPVVRRRRRRVT